MQFDGRLSSCAVWNAHHHSHRHLPFAIQLETVFLEVAAMRSARRNNRFCQSRTWESGGQRLLAWHRFFQAKDLTNLLPNVFDRLGTKCLTLSGQFLISALGILHRALGIGELQIDLPRHGAKHVLATETDLVDRRQ